MVTTPQIIELFGRYVIGNYTRYPVCLVRGEGSQVWDAEGTRYLDFFPGWGCDLLGHCPPRVVEAVRDQVTRLIHVPNTWYTEAQGLLAQALSERSGFHGQCFFCNSGTEAIEAAIKLARLCGKPGRYKIISMINSFHGRTMGAVTATGQPKYHQGIEPLLPGFNYAPFGDLDAVSRLIIENAIVPRFRANDFPGGISRGVDDIISVLTGDAEEWKQRAAKRPDPTPLWGPIINLILALVVFGLIFIFIVGAMPSGPNNRRRGRSGSGWPSGSSWWTGSSGGFSGGGFSGGGGSFGGGGSSGSW